jgi:purine-binding chemotaxis protein CheW
MDETTPPRPSIDWDALHQRLAALEAALAQGQALPPAAEQAILNEWAQVLAQTGAVTAAPGDQLEVLTFKLAHERYGLETRYVREVFPLRELTPLPGTPPHVLGLVNVRGQIISVLDLKQWFDLPAAGLTDFNKLILLAAGEMYFGVLADAILEVIVVPATGLQRTLPTFSGPREEFLLGVTADRTILLNGARLLNNPALIVHDEVDN